MDPGYVMRVSDPLEAGILSAAISEAVKLRETMDNNLAVTIVEKLAEAF